MVEISALSRGSSAPTTVSDEKVLADGDGHFALFAALFTAVESSAQAVSEGREETSASEKITDGVALEVAGDNDPTRDILDFLAFLSRDVEGEVAPVKSEGAVSLEEYAQDVVMMEPLASTRWGELVADSLDSARWRELVAVQISSPQPHAAPADLTLPPAGAPALQTITLPLGQVMPNAPQSTPNITQWLRNMMAMPAVIGSGNTSAQTANPTETTDMAGVLVQGGGLWSDGLKATPEMMGSKIDALWSTKWAHRGAFSEGKDLVYSVQAGAIFHYKNGYEGAASGEAPFSRRLLLETLSPQLTIRDLQNSMAVRAAPEAPISATDTMAGSSGSGGSGSHGQHPSSSTFFASSTLNTPPSAATGDTSSLPHLPSLDRDQLNMMHKDWEKKLSERIGRAIAEGLDEIDMEMNPRNLGRVHIQLGLDGQDVRVRLVSDNSLAAQLLSDSEQRLHQHMEAMGMRLSDFYSGHGRQQSGQNNADRNTARSKNEGKQTQGTGQQTEDLLETARNVHSYGINITA